MHPATLQVPFGKILKYKVCIGPFVLPTGTNSARSSIAYLISIPEFAATPSILGGSAKRIIRATG